MRLTSRKVLVVGMLILAGAAVGCEKTVEMTFVNVTSQSLRVELTAPGHGMRQVGVVGPTGGSLTYKLKFDEDFLPATCAWRAGSQSAEFTVTDKTDSKSVIYIKRGGYIGPVRKGTEVQIEQEIEVQEVPVRQEEVVE